MKEELSPLAVMLADALGVRITHAYDEEEPGDYRGCNFQLGGLRVKYRKAKVTPKKTGQFVALWKRDDEGKTVPFHVDDDFDLYVIETEHGNERGCFIFPRGILSAQRILSANGKDGKRGFRVYPVWDMPGNKQAIGTKSWQVRYFVDLINDGDAYLEKVKDLVKS